MTEVEQMKKLSFAESTYHYDLSSEQNWFMSGSVKRKNHFVISAYKSTGKDLAILGLLAGMEAGQSSMQSNAAGCLSDLIQLSSSG